MKTDLIKEISDAANKILSKSLIGNGNYVIISSKLYEKIRKIELKNERKEKLKDIFKK